MAPIAAYDEFENLMGDFTDLEEAFMNETFMLNMFKQGNMSFPNRSANYFRVFIDHLDLYVIPLVALAGIIGNTLSFVVFVCTFMRRLSSSIYLAALAAADLGFLVCILVSWARHIGINAYLHTGWCQALVYLTYVSSFLSVWYIVSFTTERYIAVYYPLRRQDLCTTRRAKFVVAGLAIVSFVLYMFGIWTSGVQHIPHIPPSCGPLTQHMSFVYIADNLDTVITLILPFFTILVMNIRIAYKVAKFYKERKHMSLRPTYNFSSGRFKSNCHRQCLQPSAPMHTRTTTLYTRTQVRVTKMLLTISTIFLLLNLPHHTARVYYFIMTLHNEDHQKPTLDFIAWRKLFDFLHYLQFSVNLLLYSAFGKNFRKAVCLLGKRIKYSIREAYGRSIFVNSSSHRRPLFRSTKGEITLRDYRYINGESRYVWNLASLGKSKYTRAPVRAASIEEELPVWILDRARLMPFTHWGRTNFVSIEN